MSLIAIIVVLVIVGVGLWLLDQVPISPIIKKVIWVVTILFVVLWILQATGIYHTGVHLR